MLGSKPLIDQSIYSKANKYLQKVDDRNIPHFVKALEEKEKYLAERMMQTAEYLSSLHAKKLQEKYGVDLEEVDVSSITLDMYIVGWFNYMLLDTARDIEFEEEMKTLYEKPHDDKDGK